MLKKTFLGVLFAVFVSGLLIAEINSNLTRAVDYGSSGTPVGGIIWENTTWTLENSPYIITETVQIPENVALVIEPGVVCLSSVSHDYMFLVHGTIYAHGTIDDKIVFDGGGISAFFNADGSGPDAFVDLEYCIFKNGSFFWWGGHGRFSLRHSELIDVAKDNAAYGTIFIWYPERDIFVEYNAFIRTGGFSIGHSEANVYIRYNLFKGKNPNVSADADFIIQNWASYDGSTTVVKYNSFINMSGVVLKLPAGYDGANMTATENYWETNDTNVIDSMIYDKNDDIRCAEFIEYLPILSEPHLDTPTLPLMVNFTYSPSTLYVNATVTFDASASFGPYSIIANYTWDFGDGNTVTLNTPIATHTYTMLGGYNVTLTVTDEFGFKNSTTTSVMVLQDDVPPVTVDDYDGVWHIADFTITLTATDHESGVAETYYRINNGTLNAVSTDGQPYITTEDENNSVEYWSVDNADNEELPHNILTGIKLDKTPPTIGIPSRIPEGDVQPNQIVKVFVNVTDSTSGVESVRLAYFINDSTIGLEFFMAFNSTTGFYFTSFGIPGQQANTLVRYAIRAYDNAGNYKVEDNNGQYYVYTVIPEFPSLIILPLFMIATLLAAIVHIRKHPL